MGLVFRLARYYGSGEASSELLALESVKRLPRTQERDVIESRYPAGQMAAPAPLSPDEVVCGELLVVVEPGLHPGPLGVVLGRRGGPQAAPLPRFGLLPTLAAPTWSGKQRLVWGGVA